MKAPKIRSLIFQIVVFAAFVSVSFTQDSTLDSLENTLESGTIEQKRNALYELRNLSSERASRIAVIALKDSSEIVRATATHSILYLPSDESVSLLLPLLNEKLPFVRKEAAYALGKTRNKNATESLLKILVKDKDFEVRGAAAFALGLIADERSIALLSGSLKSKNLFVQRSAARSLGEIGNPIALSSLEAKLLEQKLDDDVRREAIWAIDAIKQKQLFGK